MKYQISKDQRHFFDTHHWIEFEEVITEDDQEKLFGAIKKSISCKNFGQNLCKDLCRNIKEVRDALFLPKFSALASHLSSRTTLRYGFDELYCEKTQHLAFRCLSDERALGGLELAMMLCLKENCETDYVAKEGIDVFSKRERNAIFFTPSSLCDPKALLHHPTQTFLLFTWTNKDTLYLYNPKDPNLHELKKLGLVFGDKLKEKTHPILWRTSM